MMTQFLNTGKCVEHPIFENAYQSAFENIKKKYNGKFLKKYFFIFLFFSIFFLTFFDFASPKRPKVKSGHFFSKNFFAIFLKIPKKIDKNLRKIKIN